MSFMFNPFPYDDMTPVNTIDLSSEELSEIVSGNATIAEKIVQNMVSQIHTSGAVLAVDGYITAHINEFAGLLERCFAESGVESQTLDMSDIFVDEDTIEQKITNSLPDDCEMDPVLLYGKIYQGRMSDFFDQQRLTQLKSQLSFRQPGVITIVKGNGAADEELTPLYDDIVYMDVIPKDVVLRFKFEGAKNLGTSSAWSYKQAMRRAYYIDFEVAGRLRKKLLSTQSVSYYIAGNSQTGPVMLTRKVFDRMCKQLVRQPFRCKPVYNEGVWGGQFTKQYRNLPEDMKNCAWVFDLIPLEVSLLVQMGSCIIDFPFHTFVTYAGVPLMGQECADRFGGYFPIRFNYDDTYHSSGNMSVQVHPDESYAVTQFSEHGRQDESYYVVAVGHNAKTYLGFKDEADIETFWKVVENSQQHGQKINHDAYIFSQPSKPGTQFMIPAGTVHASGRNQVILEIGSLTVGSYTFKLYDYCRLDLDGKPRPIHLHHGKQVLSTNRRESHVQSELIQSPKEIAKGEKWTEYVVGEHDDIYFSLRRIDFSQTASQDTEDRFHVLTLVDGESVTVSAQDNPSFSYTMNFLDIIVVPAALGAYIIKNNGDQPVCIHKAMVK